MNLKIGTALAMIIFSACQSSYTPKPMGYMRIDLPEKTYLPYNDGAPYSFEIPAYAFIEEDRSRNSEPWWINVVIPDLNGKIHISYKTVQDNLYEYIEDSRTLVYKHTSQSEGIEETLILDPEHKRYGIIYDLKGDVASAVQFFVTDSSNHFIRGSLYFHSKPNRDSLNPVIDFLREDIIHLTGTISWND